MNQAFNACTGIRPRKGINVHVVNSEDWTDVDNRMSFVEIFKLLPDRHVKFVMNGRHINFKYANCLLSGLLVSERESQLGDRYQGIFDNGFSSILQDMSKKQIDNPIRKILMGTRSVSVEPWVEKLLPEHQGWFRHRLEAFSESEDTRQDTELLMRIFQAQAIQAFDALGVDRNLYSFYERKETLGEIATPVGYHGHKLDIAFSMNEEELEELFMGEVNLYAKHLSAQNKEAHVAPAEFGKVNVAQGEDYFYSTERRHRWKSLFSKHLQRLKAELGDFAEIKTFQDLLNDIGEEPSAWHLGASAVDFHHFIRSSPKQDVVFAIGQYGSFEKSGSSNIFDNQFNIELAPLAAFNAFQQPSCPVYLVTTEACKSTGSLVNRFSFDEPGRWDEFQAVAPDALVTAIKKYATDKSKPDPIFDVISSALFISLLHSYFPEVPITRSPLPLPPSQPVDLVLEGKRVNLELAGSSDNDGKYCKCRAFFIPTHAQSSWEEELGKYQTKYVNQFWNMQLEAFRSAPLSASQAWG